MQTRTALRQLSGQSHEWGDGPLAQVADQLVASFHAKEAARMDEAEARAATVGLGPILAALQSRFAEASRASLFDASVPMVTRFDAQQVLLQASRQNPDDRGLKLASAHARDLWMREPDGVLAVGDVARLREHWSREYPKSRVAQVIDEELPKVGFNTLPVVKLAQLASHIRGRTDEEVQTSYETVVRAHGLDGSTDRDRRARAYLAGLVNLTLPDERVETSSLSPVDRTLHRMAAFDDPILRAVGQLLGDPSLNESESDIMDVELEPPMSHDHEDQVPHEESGGAIVETESPVTGEPLVLELELPEGAGDEDADEAGGALEVIEDAPLEGADEGADEDDLFRSVAFLAHFGQLDDFLSPDMVEGGGEGEGEDEDEGEGSVSTVIEDPTAPGTMLEVTLDAAPSAVGFPQVDGPELKLGQRFAVFAVQNGIRAQNPLEQLEAESMSRVLAHVCSSIGDGRYEVRADPDNFAREAFVLLAPDSLLHIVAEVGTEFSPEVNEQQPAQVSVPEDGGAALRSDGGFAVPRSKRKVDVSTGASSVSREARALTKSDVETICAQLGMTASSIEDALLNADRVASEGHSLEIDGRGRIALSVGDQVVKTAKLDAMDAIIAEYMARVAHKHGASPVGSGSFELSSLFFVGCAQCGKLDEYVMPKVAAPVRCGYCGYETSAQRVAQQLNRRTAEADGRYVLKTNLPGDTAHRTLEARRILTAILQIAPKAEGLVHDDGRLEVRLAADARGLNRIQTVLTSRFGLEALSLEKTAQGGAVRQEMQSSVPAAVSNLSVQAPTAPTYSPPPVAPTSPIGQGVPSAPASGGSGTNITVEAPASSPAAPLAGPATSVPSSAPPAGAPPAPQKERNTQAARGPGLWEVAYRLGGTFVGRQCVEAASEDAARRIIAMYDADAEVISVRRAQMAPAPAPEMDAMPAGGMPAGEMSAGEMPAGVDAPEEMSGHPALTPEVQEAIQAAMMTLRNSGIDIASAVDEFQGQFKQFLERFGDKTSPARQAIGAEIIRAAQEAWSKPALLDLTAKKAQAYFEFEDDEAEDETEDTDGLGRAGQKLPAKFAPLQGKDRVNLGKPEKVLGPDSASDPKVTKSLELKSKPKSQSKPSGKMSPTDMGGGEEDRHPKFPGEKKPPKDGAYGLVGDGTSLSPTDLGPDSQNMDNATTKSWESVSKSAPGGTRSKPGGAGAPRVKAERAQAMQALASLTVKGASDASFWLRSAVEKARRGEWPDNELWLAKDAGIEHVRLPLGQRKIVKAAFAVL